MNEIRDFESNLTVTIFSEEYRDLIKAKCNFDILVGLLLNNTELGYNDRLWVKGGSAGDILQQFAPMAYELRMKELFEEKKNEEE